MHQIINFFNPWNMGKHEPDRIPRSVKQFLALPFYVFLSSLTIGSLLCVGFLITKSSHHDNAGYILYAGYGFVVIALIINLCMLIFFISYAFFHKCCTLLILQKTSILLLNIPVTVFYIFLVFQSI